MNWYTVEPIGYGCTIDFQATNLELACARARQLTYERMGRNSEWRLYDETGLQCMGDMNGKVMWEWA